MSDPQQPDDGNRSDRWQDPDDSESHDRGDRDPEGHDPDDHEGRDSIPPAPDGPIDQAMLENVLEQTLSAEPDSKLYELIVRFADRNRDRKITQPDVAEALVDEILEHRFGKVPLPTGCSEWVASSLLNDPDARDRMKKLWANAISEANA